MKMMMKYDDYNYGSGPGFYNKFLCKPELKKLWFYMIMMNLALAWRLKKSLTAAPLSWNVSLGDPPSRFIVFAFVFSLSSSFNCLYLFMPLSSSLLISPARNEMSDWLTHLVVLLSLSFCCLHLFLSLSLLISPPRLWNVSLVDPLSIFLPCPTPRWWMVGERRKHAYIRLNIDKHHI